MSKFTISSNCLSYFADKTIYHKETIMKCVYWYTSDYSVTITDYDDKYYLIEIRQSNPVDDWSAVVQPLLRKLERDLIDYSLREIIDKETRTIKELIIAKAFAPFDILDNETKK